MEVTLQRVKNPTIEPRWERRHSWRRLCSDATSCGNTYRPSRNGSSNSAVLLLIIALAAVATVLCYRTFESRVDRGLRIAVTDNLQELFPASSIFVGRVVADGPSKLVVNDVRIAAKGSTPKREVLSVERVVLQGDLDIAHYLKEQICVKQVDLFGLELNAWPLPDGSWSIDCLMPNERSKSEPPRIACTGAVVRIHAHAGADAASIDVHDIQGEIEQRPSQVSPFEKRTHINLSGRSNGMLKKLVFHSELDPIRKSMQATGEFEDLNFSPSIIEQLPPALSKYLSQLNGLQCRASSTFEIQAAPNTETSFELSGRIWAGHLQDQRLPYPFEGMSGEFFCKNSLLQLRSMKARSGSAHLTLNTDIMGFSLQSPMVIHAEANDLDLDQRLYLSLPEKWQLQWDRLKLQGRVSGRIKLSFDGQTWSPSAWVQCHDVSLEPWLFPYPLTSVSGPLVYEAGMVSSERLDGQAGGQKLHGSFRLSQSANGWLGKLQCSSDGPLSINEQLLKALTAVDKPASAAETFVRSLHPSGSIELVNATFERKSPQEATWSRSIQANIYGGRIKYDGFPYPIYDIRGRLVAESDRWDLDQFEGRNDSGIIKCSGNWLSGREGLVPFDLRFEAFDVPIEEELHAALPRDAQYIWNELQPSGAVDSLLVTVARPIGQANVDVRVELTEDSSSNEATGRSLSLMPGSFPYRLNDVACSITYEPGFVSVVHASAVNGQTRLALTGECRPTNSGRWLADVRWMPTTRVVVDSQLLKALPGSIRESLLKLDFSGPVSVFGESQLLFGNREHPDPVTSWKCQLDVEDGRLADGKNIDDLRGTVWFEGQSDGRTLHATGRLAMDVLTVRGIPATDLQGPFAIRDSDLFFGSTVTHAFPRVGEPAAPPLTADAFSGKVTLSGQGDLRVGKFVFDADLLDATLTTLLQDVGVDRASTEALCNANLHFEGIPWSTQSYRGEGRIQLSDAKLSQLPLAMRVLRTASINASDDSAFQTALINFQLDGDRIPLQIACDGDVLRLKGEGETNLRREVNLELFTYVGRRIPISNVISPLLAESRYATFMMIEVQGTLDNPIVERRPFPQIEATLQQIFPEMAERQPLRDAMPWRR
jgi:hypothetical protein